MRSVSYEAPGPDADGLLGWVEELTGGRVVGTSRPAVGGSRQTQLVEVDVDGAVRTLVLRAEAGGSFAGTDVSVEREAVVYRALAGTAVPVPAVWGVAPGGAAVLLECLPGTADLSGLSEQEREMVADDFADAIVSLHLLDVESLDLPGFARPRTVEEHATLDLAAWAGLGAQVSDLDPLIRYAGAYLLAHPPTSVARTVLVQGDTGPGNFLVHDGRLAGLVDMEFAHLGDPMDDVAWISWRCRLHGLDLARVLDRYQRGAGLAVDERSVDFYAAAVQYRCLVTTSLAVSRGGGARGWAPYLLVTQRFLLALAEALGRLAGISEPRPLLPDGDPTPRTSWYDQVVKGVRAAARAIPDASASEEARNQQILVRYLAAYDRMGADLERLDDADRVRSLGAQDDRELGRRAEEAGATGDEAFVRYLVRRTHRRAAPWSDLLERRRS